MLKSEFVEKTEYVSMPNSGSKKKKFGHYHRSYFPKVKGFGRTSWIIIADINILEECEEKSAMRAAERCLEYLNQPRGKRKPKAPYGTLSVYSASFKEMGGKSFLRTHIIIEQKKNKNFWGSGVISAPTRRRRKK